MKRKHKEIIHIPFVAAPVMIPDAIRPIFSKFAKSRTFPARQVQRAKIILLAADGLDNMQISNQVSLGQDSVSKWRSRFIKKLPLLQEVAEKDPSSLEKAVSAFLNDSPRPDSPCITRMSRSSRSLKLPAATRRNWGMKHICAKFT